MGLKSKKPDKNSEFEIAKKAIIEGAPMAENIIKASKRKKPPEEYVVQISFRLKRGLLEEAREMSKIEELSLNRFLIQCVKDKLASYNKN